MKELSIAVMGLLCLTSNALAVDWSVRSTLSESVELNDNTFLATPRAAGVGSFSSVTGNFLARTPTTTFNFDGDFNYRKYWGPAANNTPLSESDSNRLSARYEVKGKSTADRTFFEGSWFRSSAALAILNDFGLNTNASGDVNVTNLQAGFVRAPTNIDTFNLTVRGSSTDYVPSSGGTHFMSVGGTAVYSRKLNSLLDASLASDTEWLWYDNATRSTILISRETMGIQARLSPLLSLSLNGGIAYIQSDNAGSFATPLTTSSSSIGFVGDAVVTYKLLKNTDVSAFARRSVGPGITGDLFQRTSYGTSLQHAVNYTSNLTASADYTQQITSGGSSDFFSASIAYSKQLTREWTAQVSYRFLHRGATTGVGGGAFFDPVSGLPVLSAGSGPARSNSLLLVVSRSLTVLPPGN